MTREEARKAAEVMIAYADGKEIELNGRSSCGCKMWEETSDPTFNWYGFMYRTKPEPKYRPFKNQEECWNEMLKHQPFGWVKDEFKYVHIVCVHENEIEFSPDEGNDCALLTCTIDFTSVCEQGYTFADGTPFGIKE